MYLQVRKPNRGVRNGVGYPAWIECDHPAETRKEEFTGGGLQAGVPAGQVAKTIGGRTGGPGGGPAAAGGGGFLAAGGTLGKDYVMGQVKSIDPPRLTILRTDNVTQTLELTEETTLRRGRESITMADIQVGDHVVAHGAVQNNLFVPKGVMVMGPEQWQRMQDFMSQANGPAGKPANSATPASKP